MDIIRNVEGALWVRLSRFLGVGRTRTGLKGAGLAGGTPLAQGISLPAFDRNQH